MGTWHSERDKEENRSHDTINTYLALSEGQGQKCEHCMTSDTTTNPKEMVSIRDGERMEMLRIPYQDLNLDVHF